MIVKIHSALEAHAIPPISFNYNLIYMLIVMIYLLMTYD